MCGTATCARCAPYTNLVKALREYREAMRENLADENYTEEDRKFLWEEIHWANNQLFDHLGAEPTSETGL